MEGGREGVTQMCSFLGTFPTFKQSTTLAFVRELKTALMTLTLRYWPGKVVCGGYMVKLCTPGLELLLPITCLSPNLGQQ